MGAIKIIVSKELVEELAATGAKIGPATCTYGLPPNSTFKLAGTDKYGNLLLRFEGPNLPECNPGEKPGTITPTYEKMSI